MNKRRLRKLQQELDALQRRKGNISANEMEKFALNCGRYRSQRGKEPTYLSEWFPERFPLSIPAHSSRNLKIGTAANILRILEEDLFLMEEKLDAETEEDDD